MAAKFSSSSEGLSKLEEQLTCPICLDHFNSPKVLPCLHSFCLDCLEGVPTEFVKGSYYLHCPTCRLSCPVPDNGLASLPPSFVINNFIEVYSLLKKVSGDQHASCDNCDNTNADRYCKQCTKFFCLQCLHHHDNWKPNAGHETISLEEVASTAYQLPQAKPEDCTDHNKPLEIFCETCQELICHNCTVKQHKDHDYDVVSDTYSKHEDEITKCGLQPLNKERDRLAEESKVLMDRINEVTQQADTTDDEIRQTITEIKNRLDETERKLKGNVALAKKHKVSVLQCQLKEADTSLGLVTECIDHVEQCMKVATPYQILSTKSQMMNRTESVMKQVKDKSFKPLEQADIELVKSDKIDELHNNIGDIEYTSFLSSVKVNVTRLHIHLVGQESMIAVSLSLPKGSLVPVTPSCSLTPPDNGRPIQCTVKESSQSGQYNVVFTPVTRGQHELHVAVSGVTIPGSPVNIPVTVPLKMRDKPIKTITGLNKPSGVAVTDDGLLVVSECDGHCITIMDREGKKMKSFGSKGNGRGQLNYPRGVAITTKGTVLVSDCGNHRIQEYTMEGICISCVGTKGNGPLQFSNPIGITINKITGQVFIADRCNDRVQVLNPDLTFSHTFGNCGSNQGQFNYPFDVTIDSKGFVFVTDCFNHRMQKFTTKGLLASLFKADGPKPHPSGITVDDNDLVYVNNFSIEYVSVYTTNGEHVGNIDKKFDGNKESVSFQAISYDDNTGCVYVCCSHINLIHVF